MVILSKRHLRNAIGLLIATTISTISLAEVNKSKEVNPQKWFADWRSKNPTISPRLLTSVLIVSKVDDTYRPADINAAAEAPSIFSTPVQPDILINTELNRSGTDVLCYKSLGALAKCFKVSLILDISEDSWKLYSVDAPEFKSKAVVKGKGDKDRNFRRWLHSSLNYDGIVLAQNGDLLLSIVPDHPNTDESQGLILGDSADKKALKKQSTKGVGLIHLVQREGRLGVFKIILNDQSEFAEVIKPLSKIILEQKKTEGKDSEEDNIEDDAE